MPDRNFNPPAFPALDYFQRPDGTGGVPVSQGGMTLRDYFAAKAMHAEVLAINTEDEAADAATEAALAARLSYSEYVATKAYRMADAMLKVRQR